MGATLPFDGATLLKADGATLLFDARPEAAAYRRLSILRNNGSRTGRGNRWGALWRQADDCRPRWNISDWHFADAVGGSVGAWREALILEPGSPTAISVRYDAGGGEFVYTVPQVRRHGSKEC